MKIERVQSQIVRLPADEPLADGKVASGTTRDIVVVRILTRDGIEGVGVSFFGAGMTNALKTAVDDLGAVIVGEDPHQVERIVDNSHACRLIGTRRRIRVGAIGHRHGAVGHPR